MKQRRGIRNLRLRKVVIRAGIFLLLGAIVNVAVAWGCAARMYETAHSLATPTPTEILAAWKRAASASWPAAPTESKVWKDSDGSATGQGAVRQLSVGADRLHVAVSYHSGNGRDDHLWTTDYIVGGWPMLALQGDVVYDGPHPPMLAVAVPLTCHNALQAVVPARLMNAGVFRSPAVRHIPTKPIWPGFATNTLFYAAILWLLLALPGALRRWRRIKRGLCPACAYPVGASDLCTECGNKLNITAKMAARQRMGLPPPATPALDAERTK